MKIIKIAAFAIVTTFIACGQNNQNPDNGQDFSLLQIKTEDVSLSQSYSASIRGRQDIKIVPRVDGYLTDILIKEGDKVRKGQTLFIIDQVSFKAALQVAQANVAMCEANMATSQITRDSKKALYDKKIVSNFDLASAENALKTAKAQLQQAVAQADAARNNLSFTVIKSPSDGVAGKIPYRMGDYVNAAIQEGLTVIADNSQMYVYFSMAERQIMELLRQYKSMDTAIAQMPDIQLQLCDESVYPQSGRIESISGVIDQSTGAASIRAVFPNQDKVLLSGGAGSVILPYKHSGAIVIPQEATFEIQDKTYVYKVVDGVTVSTIIAVDKINNGKEFIVTGGLGVDDTIIAKGAGLVRAGTKVNASKTTN